MLRLKCTQACRNVSLLHAPVSLRARGALRATRPNLMPIPPAAWRLLSVAGLFLLDAFLKAHRQQVKQQDSGTSSSTATQVMSSSEALSVLGLPVTPSSLPLTKPDDLMLAEKRFTVLFEKARMSKSPYLQGKVTAAYTLCTGKSVEIDDVPTPPDQPAHRDGGPSA